MGTDILVVSHNIENGRGGAKKLLSRYKLLEKRLGRRIDVLCIQENNADDFNIWPADLIAQGMGTEYRIYFDREGQGATPPFSDPVVIWNSEHLKSAYRFMQPIPRLHKYTRFEKALASDAPLQRLVVGARFSLDDSEPFDVVSMHLDSWGGSEHKLSQLKAIADMRDLRGGTNKDGSPVTERRIFAGDTNIFTARGSLSKKSQRNELKRMLNLIGLVDPETMRTHHFSRLPKSSLSGWLIYMGAVLGILPACRLDTIASNMPFLGHGVLNTPESDHDLTWAIIQVA